MKLTARSSRNTAIIEPLEQRIAPALLVNGANLLVAGTGSGSFGAGALGNNTVTRVQVLSGEAIVWYDHGSLDAISVGPNTSLQIWGDVGTIVGNLTASGKLSDSDNNPANGLDGNVLLANNITGIVTHPLSPELGTVGNIITGGSVSNLNISGNLEGVYAGNGAFYTGNANPLLNSRVLSAGQVLVDAGVDINPIVPGVQHTFTFAASNANTVQSGASISNVTMAGAEELQMFAGDGHSGVGNVAGLAGGSVSKITITNAFIDTGLNASTPSYFIKSGAGGNGVVGGAGGNISGISEVNSTGIVDIIAAGGGTGSKGYGGAGGSVSGLNMQSVSSAYTIHAGQGGQGAPGGAGGSVTGVNFGGNELSNGIIVAAPFTGAKGSTVDDILLIDSQSGTMVIEQNQGPGTGFTPVVQDNMTQLQTIAPVGSDPVAAIAYTDATTGLPDIVVAYKGTESLGYYVNQGGGIFYTQNYSSGVYTGDTVNGTVIALPYAPELLAVGNFVSGVKQDLAVLANNAGTTELITLQGNGTGGFAQLPTLVALPSNPVSLVTANDFHGGNFDDLFVGFQSGVVESLESTGSAVAAPFNPSSTVTNVSGGLLNLDYNPQDNLLLALNGTGTAITTYVPTISGTLYGITTLDLTTLPGTALVAHFVPETQNAAEPIEVLSSVSSGSRLDLWNPQGSTFVLSSSVSSPETLKNFVPVIEGNTSGVVAVGGSLEHFSFSQNGASFFDVSLPFSGKKVSIGAGDGGDGVNSITNVAAGGAGGSIAGMSILAGDITLNGGNGGSSENAPAGAGGAVTDTPSLVTITGAVIPTLIDADFVLTVGGGNGGLAVASSSGLGAGSARSALGGAGGSVNGLNLAMQQGDILINAGYGNVGGGNSGGAGGSIMAINAVDNGGNILVGAGDGGAANGSIGNGGAGGSITNFNYTLSLSNPGSEVPYNVDLTAGYGGQSASGAGGAGGSLSGLALSLQTPFESVNNANAIPSSSHTNTDSTLRVDLVAGYGGQGATGGAGGAVRNSTLTAVYEQLVTIVAPIAADDTTFRQINPIVATITAGYGGQGTKGAGGAGGAVASLNLLGLSHYDPDSADPNAGGTALVITSGYGGEGSTTGGAGGAITLINSENAQFVEPSSSTGTGTPVTGGGNTVINLTGTQLSSASITSGYGGKGDTGTGGTGGTISSLSVSVQGFYQDSHLSVQAPTTGSTQGPAGGGLAIISGAGGQGGAIGRGGAAGSITSSTVGSTDAFDIYGVMLQGGIGGQGGLGGGTGGNVSNIQLNSPENPISYTGGYDVISSLILAGNGGAATGATAIGGTGGSISGITEAKDVNSAINLIQAGNGGNAVATGGLGGSVTSVNTVGLIGQASDNSVSFGVFQTQADTAFFSTLFPEGIPQGVFAGEGGTGVTAGLAGSVYSIRAAQIAAIGAAANSSGYFGAAERVAGITAESIAYDLNGNGVYDNQSGNSAAPSAAVPIDGFLYSVTAATGISVVDPTLLKAFTFVG
jgi:hypothetical protein